MPTLILDGTSQYDISSSGFFFMNDDVVLTSSTHGIDVDADDVNLYVNGTVVADQSALLVAFGSDRANVHIGEFANLVGQDFGLNVDGGSSEVVSYGSITGLSEFGVNMQSGAIGGSSFVNYGSVAGNSIGIAMQGTAQYAVNHGTVSGKIGVRFGASDSVFVNHGDVTSSSAIGGTGSYGVQIRAGYSDTETWNFGTITGNDAAFFANAFPTNNTSLYNHGTMVGQVNFGDQNDKYRAGPDGIVVGEILMGAGEDDVRAGHHADDIDGGADNDVLNGRGGDDTIVGGTGDDFVRGGHGDDELDGGSGADVLDGGRGDDFIVGGSQSDILRGGRDNDTLNGGRNGDLLDGGSGEDLLFGDHGNDTLNGGAGDDTLNLGTGNDVIIFNRNDGRDTVVDFVNGFDKIDLSDFGLFSFASLTSTYTVDLFGPNGSYIDFGNGDVLILQTIPFGNLADSDVIF